MIVPSAVSAAPIRAAICRTSEIIGILRASAKAFALPATLGREDRHAF
jgi:hypothetical protein